MPLYIDGHNLIGSGHLPSISLADDADEEELLRLIRRYRSRVRGKITVFFDGGILGGHAADALSSSIEVVYAARGRSDADSLIAGRLRRSRNPRGITVITDDHEIARTARQRGARVTSTREFAQRLLSSLPSGDNTRQDPPIASEEVDEWLKIFGEAD